MAITPGDSIHEMGVRRVTEDVRRVTEEEAHRRAHGIMLTHVMRLSFFLDFSREITFDIILDGRT